MDPPHPKRLQNLSLVSTLRKGSPLPIQTCLSEVANERGEIAETPDGLHSNQYATRLLKKIEEKIDAEINGDRSHGDVQLETTTKRDASARRKTSPPSEQELVAKACPSAWVSYKHRSTFVVADKNTSLTVPSFSTRTSMSKLFSVSLRDVGESL